MVVPREAGAGTYILKTAMYADLQLTLKKLFLPWRCAGRSV